MLSVKKDVTSDNTNTYSFLRKIYNISSSKINTSNSTYIDSSSYIQNKKSIGVGKTNSTLMFKSNNNKDINRTLRRIRSSGR